jgi:hypothetical protein
MKTSFKIGIDPGINGAIAFVSDKLINFFDMPICYQFWSKKQEKMVDTKQLYQIIKKCPHEIESINIEVVHSMPAQGVSSTWKFAGAFYSMLAIVNQFDYQVKMILPTQWKKKFGLINMPKDASRLVVLKMYPHLLPKLKRKKDVDRAEALLIAVS